MLAKSLSFLAGADTAGIVLGARVPIILTSRADSLLARLADRLCRRYRQEATAGWRWFEPALTYDNALLPLALWRAHALTRDPESRDVAREALDFLEAACFRDDRLVLVGNAGWHVRGGTRSRSTPRRSCSRSGPRTS